MEDAVDDHAEFDLDASFGDDMDAGVGGGEGLDMDHASGGVVMDEHTASGGYDDFFPNEEAYYA
jgi:hypothetical protein